VGNRGLAKLFPVCADDFAQACRSLAEHPAPVVGIVTGFWIASVQKGETDGPLGAAYLARTFAEMGIAVQLIGDSFCERALQLAAPTYTEHRDCTHLLAIERAGPSHHDGRCYNMRGVDITPFMRDVSSWFDTPDLVTLGIGDGGNEIGMGKLPREFIHDNIPNGHRIACRVATHHLIVAGISNWGAYALACGVALCKGHTPSASWFDVERERAMLHAMIEHGDLVDGVTGQAIPYVDGLAFDEYIQPLRQLEQLMRD
jgi:hypothetical protein